MVIYIALFIIMVLLGFLQYSSIYLFNGKTIVCGKRLYFAISIFLLAGIEGLRNITVGEDLVGYINWFYYYQQIDFAEKGLFDFSSFEPGFIILNKIIGAISTSEQHFILLTSVIIVFLNLFFLYKNSKDFYLSVLLFMGFNHFFTSMVSLRQYLAIGIAMWCYPLIQRKMYSYALIIALIAVYFHQSSVLLSFVLFIATILKNHRKIVLFLGCALMASLPFTSFVFSLLGTVFPKYVGSYSFSLGATGSIGYLRILYMLIELTLLFLLCFNSRFKYENKYVFYSILLFFAIYCGFLGLYLKWAFRIGFYFDYFLLLLIPDMLEKFPLYKKAFRVGVIVVATFFYFYYVSVNPGQTVPYEFY